VKRILLTFLLACGFLVSVPNATSAGVQPKFTVNCGPIVGGIDQNGTYGLFKPNIAVQYYGRKLKVIAYFYPAPDTPKSEAGQSIFELSNSYSPGRAVKQNLNLERKLLPYGQAQTGYYRIVIEATDSLNRVGRFNCLYENYYFRIADVDPVTGYSNLGLNKLACAFKGKNLYGNVQIVDYGQDFNVQIVDYGQDLKVKEVEYGATSCGLWKIVSYGAAFKIKLVDYGADFKIKIVDYGAGF